MSGKQFKRPPAGTKRPRCNYGVKFDVAVFEENEINRGLLPGKSLPKHLAEYMPFDNNDTLNISWFISNTDKRVGRIQAN